MQSYTGNYFCTWLSQYKTLPTYEAGCDVTNVRDRMCADFMWGERGLLHAIDTRVRGDITVLLDDGWDVPFGTTSKKEDRHRFGSLIPDEKRFPDCKGKPAERLLKISEKVKSLGYRGLGLWICCNLAEENENGEKKIMTASEAEKFWIRNAKISNEAGILYWKVDWGYHDRDTEYREMLTKVVKKYAPNLRIEHSLMQNCFNSKTDENYRHAIKNILAVSDYLRTYDCVEELMYPITLSRTAELLREDYTPSCECRGIPNIEDLPILGAALGCSMGIMRHKAGYWNELCLDRADVAHRSNEVARSLIWHRVAPPFGCRETSVYISDEVLTDRWKFDVHPLDWTYNIIGGKTLDSSAPAVISRGTPPPRIDNECLQKPFVVASKNPNGAYSIATLPRTTENEKFIEYKCAVTAEAGDDTHPIGIFGRYEKLTLSFDRDLSGKRIYACDILAFADGEFGDIAKMTDITEKTELKKNTLSLSGDLLWKTGTQLQSDGDRSSPACVLIIK